MNGQLISLTIWDKSLILHITKQVQVNKQCLRLLAMYDSIAVKRIACSLHLYSEL